MRQYNPDKKIKIQIVGPINPADEYTIWHKNTNHCITRKATESQMWSLLETEQFNRFKEGKYNFTVTANQLVTYFDYLY